MTIVEFIEARIAEDERIAQSASKAPWSYDTADFAATGWGWVRDSHWTILTCDGDLAAGAVEKHNGEHMARHDPARVLRQCEALRDALAAARDQFAEGWSKEDAASLLTQCLASTARIWADHPDYRQEWA